MEGKEGKEREGWEGKRTLTWFGFGLNKFAKDIPDFDVIFK